MKPVAIVDGQMVQVEGVSYSDGQEYSVMVQPNYKTLYLERDSVSLIWENRYAPIIEEIQKRIEAHEEYMNELAIEFIESNRPFEVEVQKEYHELKTHVNGLKEALEAVIELNNTHIEKLEVI